MIGRELQISNSVEQNFWAGKYFVNKDIKYFCYNFWKNIYLKFNKKPPP